MKPRTLGSSIWLVAIGAATVLLIGAFARFDSTREEIADAADETDTNSAAGVVSSAKTVASDAPAPPVTASAPTLPADLSPGLAEIIKLAQAHVGDDVVLAFIQNSGQTYTPTADEVLYLSDLGVSDKVVAALFKKPEIVAAAPATPAPSANGADTPSAPGLPAAGVATTQDGMVDPPPAMPDDAPLLQSPQDSYFYDSLAPYGSWVQIGDDGWFWQPMVASVNADWLPYRDRGHWVLSDDGWYWASDYSWGWSAFHYGRWRHDGRFGWVWAPGSVWAPAWVAWRTTDTHSGWAPLPPGVSFRPGFGLIARRGLGGVDVSFGLSPSWFTFVSFDHFLARNLTRFAVAPAQAEGFFKSSAPVNNYSAAGGRIRNVGVSAERIAAATGTRIAAVKLREASSPDTANRRMGGQAMTVYRPKISAGGNGGPASMPAAPIRINKAPQRAAQARVALASDYAGTAEREASGNARAANPSPGRPGFTTGNFQPAPHFNQAPAPNASAASRSYYPSGVDVRRPPPVPETATDRNYSGAAQPSYNSRAYNQPTGGGYGAPSHSAPTYSPPPSAPMGGAGESSRGNSSSGSSSSSQNGSKTYR